MNLEKGGYGDSRILAKDINLRINLVDDERGLYLPLAETVIIVIIPEIVVEGKRKRVPIYEHKRIKIVVVPMSTFELGEFLIQTSQIPVLIEEKSFFVITLGDYRKLEKIEHELRLQYNLPPIPEKYSISIKPLTLKEKIYKTMIEFLDRIA